MPPVKWVVVIDPGHGGKDPGCIGTTKTKEKDVVLSIALKTGEYIKKYLPDVKVLYTRDDDTFVGLKERAEYANDNNASIFISIHANATTDNKPKGAETWIMGQAKDEANLRLAMKENAVITYEDNYQAKYEGYDPNSAESFIIFSTMQNTYIKQSTEFATRIQDQFRDRVGLVDRSVKQGNLLVLWMTTMPSVLVEVGFLSNPDEEKSLNTSKGQEYIASAIYRAFKKYKQTIDYRSGVKAALTDKGDDDIRDQATTVNNAATAATTSSKSATPSKDASAKFSTPVSGTSDSTSDNSAKAGTPADTTGEIWFAVQIASAPKNSPKNINTLKNAGTVTRIDAGDRYKYISGKYNNYDDATQNRRKISDLYPDAFVVAFKGQKMIPLMEALKK
jgi:N-acetylmuramoyl-L-alanine amidase